MQSFVRVNISFLITEKKWILLIGVSECGESKYAINFWLGVVPSQCFYLEKNELSRIVRLARLPLHLFSIHRGSQSLCNFTGLL